MVLLKCVIQETNKPNRNKSKDAENILMVAGYKGSWRDGLKIGKGLGGTNWLLQNSQGKVKYSLRNIINNAVITMSGIRWVLHVLW